MSWMIVLVLLAGAGMAAIEMPSLIKKRQTKELVLFSLLVVIFVFVGTLQSADIPVPNPLDWLAFVLEPIGNLFFGARK